MQKNEAAQAMGRLSAAKRKASGYDYKPLAKKMADARWKKHREKKSVDK